jgi:hypothetical protein
MIKAILEVARNHIMCCMMRSLADSYDGHVCTSDLDEL